MNRFRIAALILTLPLAACSLGGGKGNGDAQQCTPNCDGKKCGDDGCGGSCGKCDDGQVCG